MSTPNFLIIHHFQILRRLNLIIIKTFNPFNFYSYISDRYFGYFELILMYDQNLKNFFIIHHKF